MTTYYCASCGNTLDEPPATLVFRATTPGASPPSCCEVDGFFPGNGWESACICDSAKCLKSFLEKVLLNEYDFSIFESSQVGPGMWFGPNGCIHFLKNVHPTSKVAVDWLEYAFRISETAGPKLEATHEKMFAEFSEEFDKVETKVATISFIGGYGHIFDGCFHFCDPFCALATFFPGEYLSKYRWMAELLSYSGLPDLHGKLYRERST